jgi:hypothetical protein
MAANAIFTGFVRVCEAANKHGHRSEIIAYPPRTR